MKFLRFKDRAASGHDYGWTENCTGWYFTPPRYQGDGPDQNGWAGFVVAHIYRLPTSFLAVDFGCYWDKSSGGSWENSKRAWAPAYTVHDTLMLAQGWIETRLLNSILKGIPQ
jgi:hypothetical protein